jgi:transcriptional regulator with XRE-family HTH domain
MHDCEGVHKTELDALYAEFGSKVRQKRLEAGLRQSEVAERVGLTRASISNLEAGRQRPLLHQVYELARTLHTDLHDLLPTIDVDVDVTRHEQLRERVLNAADARPA